MRVGVSLVHFFFFFSPTLAWFEKYNEVQQGKLLIYLRGNYFDMKCLCLEEHNCIVLYAVGFVYWKFILLTKFN